MHPLTAVLSIALTAAGIVGVSPASQASAPCTKWASTSGDDANPGTAGAPYRSLGKLVASMPGGGTGCLPAGQTYYAVAGNGVISGGGQAAAEVVITSSTGTTAIVKGQLWLTPSSHDIALTGLRFLGNFKPDGTPNGTKATHLIIHGDRITIADNEISDPRGICIGAGKADQLDASVNDVAADLRVLDNDIHGCGMAPDITWNPGDSGAHGVYLENTVDAVISGNYIHDNRYRGLQLWPRNDGAEIDHNLFAHNATHINIGSSLSCTGTCRPTSGRVAGRTTGSFKAENTDVHDNVFVDRVTDWRPSQNPSQVYGFFPAGSPDYGNRVRHNCFAPDDATATGDGFALSGVVVEAVDVRVGIAADDRCAQMGPDWLTTPDGSGEPSGPDEPGGPSAGGCSAAGWSMDLTVTSRGRSAGSGVCSRTGRGQTLSRALAVGQSARFQFRLTNRSAAADNYSVADQQIASAGFRVRYRLAGRDVTDLVHTGNLCLTGIAPQAMVRMEMIVTATRAAVRKRTATWLVHAVHDPLSDDLRDVVRIRVIRR